jgi:hypothetical protein
MIELITPGKDRIFVRIDRIESFLDIGALIHVRMMSGTEHKVSWDSFEPARQRILDYWGTLPVPIVNPGQEKG